MKKNRNYPVMPKWLLLFFAFLSLNAYARINPPTFNPVGGTYSSPQSVVISSSVGSTTIRYTTDGTTPTATYGIIYTAPVAIAQNTTLKAIVYKTNNPGVISSVATGYYYIKCATPVFNPVAGTYTSSQTVTITTTTNGATIRYTTDGTTPSQSNGTVYTSPVTISETTTLKAIAYKTGMNDSPITSGTYTINIAMVAAPTFDPAAGTYTSAQTVTIASATSGATIRYTTDGSSPSQSNGIVYTYPVTISATTTLKAIAYKTGMNDSPITSGTYAINLLTVEAPSFDPAPGNYSYEQAVSITSATSGATIRYTTDGTAPSQSNGTVYTSPVTISATATLKAIAYKAGMLDSDVTSGTYTIQSSGGCAITKSNGGGFTTTISSVIKNVDNTYTIVLTVEHDGCPGPICKELSHYSIEAVPNTYSDVSVNVVSGNMTYSNINLGPNLGSDPFQGFKIDGTSGIGDGQAGKFTVTYTVNVLQTERTSAKAGTNSQIASFTLQDFQYVYNCGVTNTVAAPTFDPLPGTYTSMQTVTISTATSGATIRYTSDGSTPTETNGTIYTGPVEISSTTTLKAIAYKSGMTTSAVASGIYTIDLTQVSEPTFLPVPGTYGCDQTITLTTETEGATIRYTLDGSVPSYNGGTIYTTPFTISATTTVKAIAYKTGMSNSDVVSVLYTIEAVQVATPTFSPVPGTYNVTQSVTITCTTADVNIKYTTDGSTPSASNGIAYSGPVSISTYTLLKAIAYKDCMLNSEVASGIYNIEGGNSGDGDGDGVPDNEDEFPADPQRAFSNYYPANGFGTLAYEDLWPGKGDYDFNDLVLDYRFNVVTNANNYVVETFGTFVINAFGASYENGFGFQFGNSSINASDMNITGYELKENYITLNSNGTEAGQAMPTIIVYDNAFKQMQHPGTGIGVNTEPTATYVTPDTLNITITFISNTYTFDQVNIAGFNPFLIVNKTRGREIHLPDYSPTSLVDPAYFGTYDDNTIASQNRYYKTERNLPWAINIYESFDYPIEKTPILDTYTHFAEWAQSGGTLYPDWYRNLTGYRINSNVYQKP